VTVAPESVTVAAAPRKATPRPQKAGAQVTKARTKVKKASPPVTNVSTPKAAGRVGLPASKRVLRSQGRRTMRKLLDAAMICFDERGYYETRVNDVVKIAKTSHGTFYLYFSNKEDLLRALVAEAGTAAQHLADALNRPPELGGTPQWEDVRGWVSVYSDLWIRYAALFRAWTDLARIDPELTNILRQTFTLMSDAVARQITPDDAHHTIDPQAAAMGVLAMLDRFHYVREFVRQPVDDVALDTLATMVYRALFEESRQGHERTIPPTPGDRGRGDHGARGHAREVGDHRGNDESLRGTSVTHELRNAGTSPTR
jgi:AcrR family transcriptional regulator